MRVIFDIDVDAWIKGIEVEGNSLEDAKDNLRKMTLEEMFEAGGWVKDHSISEDDITANIEEVNYKVLAKDIYLEDGTKVDDMVVEINYYPNEPYDLKDCIKDEVEYVLSKDADYKEVDSFEYEILEEK